MKKNNKLISVIINVYNAEKYIEKCLESVINQTYKNLEILIINDGSTDNSIKLCKKYKDKRIKIITTENMGLAASRNVGIDNATGDYLYFVDADDYIKEDAIEYLYDILVKNNADVSTSKCIDIYDYDFTYQDDEENILVSDGYEYLDRILLSIDRCGTTWNKLFKKELFDGLRFEVRIINDMAFMYKIALRCKTFVFSNQIKYYYLRTPGSITGRQKPDRAMDMYLVGVDRYNYIDKVLPNKKENKVGLLHAIVMVYNHNDKSVDEFLNKNNARKLFKKHFSLLMVLKSRIKRKEKFKIILYRISPKLERYIQVRKKEIKK